MLLSHPVYLGFLEWNAHCEQVLNRSRILVVVGAYVGGKACPPSLEARREDEFSLRVMPNPSKWLFCEQGPYELLDPLGLGQVGKLLPPKIDDGFDPFTIVRADQGRWIEVLCEPIS